MTNWLLLTTILTARVATLAGAPPVASTAAVTRLDLIQLLARTIRIATAGPDIPRDLCVDPQLGTGTLSAGALPLERVPPSAWIPRGIRVRDGHNACPRTVVVATPTYARARKVLHGQPEAVEQVSFAVSHQCGPLCGTGEVISFYREPGKTAWVFDRRSPTWIS